jgi:hypothetical protein
MPQSPAKQTHVKGRLPQAERFDSRDRRHTIAIAAVHLALTCNPALASHCMKDEVLQ